ncbi:MAG: lipoyl synthase [Nitrospinota bacterium]
MPPRFPPWMRKRLNFSEETHRIKVLMRQKRLHTVCEEARCPNLFECWSKPTATFMILGDVCTRSCGFCAVATGRPFAVDPHEPENLAEAAAQMGLRHVVVTSVDRDDLPDKGAAQFVWTIEALRRRLPTASIEVLTPDFRGKEESIDRVIEARPDIFNHNIETVPRLYRKARRGADYRWSLMLLRKVADAGLSNTKSGIMVGLGERQGEVLETMRDLRDSGCQILTIGQYLQPTQNHLPIEEFAHPGVFAEYERRGLEMGFGYVFSGPFVRSSFNAEAVYGAIQAKLPQANHGNGAAEAEAVRTYLPIPV